jgi:hypothetical protein
MVSIVTLLSILRGVTGVLVSVELDSAFTSNRGENAIVVFPAG